MDQASLTEEQRAALRIDNTDSYKAHALPKDYNPAIPPSGVQMLPTKRVRFKESDVEATINASDFDPELHEELGAAKASSKASGRRLADLKVDELKALAEKHEVALEDGAKKAEIVAALEAAGVSAE